MIKDDYSDIINLEHHKSKVHPHMSRIDRAAQFAPFAALVGFEDEVSKVAKKVNNIKEETERFYD